MTAQPPEEAKLALWRFRIERSVELFLGRLQTTTSIALATINALFLVNGGAIIALITLISQGAASPPGKALSSGPFVWFSFGAYVAGLALALAAALFGFWSQQAYATYEHEIAEHHFDVMYGVKPRELDERDVDRHNLGLALAGICMILSLVAFAAGSALALTGALPQPHHPETTQERAKSP